MGNLKRLRQAHNRSGAELPKTQRNVNKALEVLFKALKVRAKAEERYAHTAKRLMSHPDYKS